MQPTWRWFGPDDPVDLERARQAGATGVVSALSEIPLGEVWPLDAIFERQRVIAAQGLDWRVVESLPVHPAIRLQEDGHARLVDNYRRTLEHLGRAGIRCVCYNFMPVLDWTRTHLGQLRSDGTRVLGFDQTAWAAFDLYLLERPAAVHEYSEPEQARARAYHQALTDTDREALVKAAIGGLPGANEAGHSLESLRRQLDRWSGVTGARLFENLVAFLEQLLPVLEQYSINLCIHPDDPPRPLLGLPRILSSAADCRRLFTQVPSLHNGLTLCAGSFAAAPENQPHEIAREFAERVHFAHLRSVAVEGDQRSFSESDHLCGDVRLVELVRVLVQEERRRKQAGRSDAEIAMRPDHGATLKGDIASLPGYSWLGRLKGLAELRGVLHAVEALT